MQAVAEWSKAVDLSQLTMKLYWSEYVHGLQSIILVPWLIIQSPRAFE